MKGSAFLKKLLLLLSSALPAVPAGAAVRNLEPGALKELLDAEPANIFLLDVRTTPEFVGGHLRGSKLIPMNSVPKRLGEIPKGRKIVVICATGARSAAVARYLDQAGYPWVADLKAGVVSWMRQGLPVER